MVPRPWEIGEDGRLVEWHELHPPTPEFPANLAIRGGHVFRPGGTRLHRPRRVWLPDCPAGWVAAPCWILAWLVTLGRFGRLPWRWELGPPPLPLPPPNYVRPPSPPELRDVR